MRIITSTRITEKYGPGVLDIIKKLGPNIDVLDRYDFNHVKCHIDDISDDILIFGGPDVIPFGIMANPSSCPDSDVQTDNPYASVKDQTSLIPDKVVTRLPDEQVNWSLEYIDNMVNNQLSFLNGINHNGWGNIVASVWKGISDYTETMFSMNTQNVVPPDSVQNLSELLLQPGKFWVLNLHGSKSVPGFYGQSGGSYPLAISPNLGMFKNCVVFSEACYGAYLDGRDKNTSIPLMSLNSGVAAFVGSSRTAFGPPAPPAQAADLLGQKFFLRFLNGETIGNAFLHAKQDFASETIMKTGSLDPEAKLTLLEFICYGHTNIKIIN